MLTTAGDIVADPLLNIPIVMPLPVALGPEGARLLAPPQDEPDYTIHALGVEPLALPAATGTAPSTDASERADANTALDDMEAASRLSEYHDFDWWQARISRVRAGLQR